MSGLGLLLIAIGTGGLKPCVAAFGAEQFRLPEQRALLRYFFSLFYFTINLGGFIGMTLTPVLRKAVTCFGDDTCYALGFGFPALLMVLSILLFVLGKTFYKLKTPKRNIMLEFVQCSWCALLARLRRRAPKHHHHWLDYGKQDFDSKLIQDMKVVFAILLLFVPLPIFWSLFDQQGSRWTFQVAQAKWCLASLLIAVGFSHGRQSVRLPNRPRSDAGDQPANGAGSDPPLRQAAVSAVRKGAVADQSAASHGDWRDDRRAGIRRRCACWPIAEGVDAKWCVLAGILELVLERSYPDLPGKHQGSLNVVNTLPCSLVLYSPFSNTRVLEAAKLLRIENLRCHNRSRYWLTIDAPTLCGSTHFSKEHFEVAAILEESQEDTYIISVNEQREIQGFITDPVDFRKSVTGAPKLRVDFIQNSNTLENVTVALKGPTGVEDVYFVGASSSGVVAHVIVSPYIEVPQGVYECTIGSQRNPNLYQQHFHFALGGVYSLIIRENHGKIQFVKLYTMSDPNCVNILWQIPQYFLISVAEIMFGVAGLEFSFTQAPKSMKTVTIAGWYLSTAVGNLLVIIITQLNLFKSQAHEFFLFAVLIVADMVIFMEMVCRYRFVQLEVDSSALIMSGPTNAAQDD
ncbi:solute carrier family 15 member 2-like isoform X2 [Dendroctonus ponderosae]|uniref:solute carrier family 15 member 2-like isoform X2 n=1 Tax=Dendroctonus ponderosae TaxID=77166 RepID=UPI0020355361|nr:solute carrier family 15 member 2-like isoform X2 [Dendroctonus ponderosae]